MRRCLAAAGLFILLTSAVEAAPPPWAEDDYHLGSMRSDGQLHLSIPLGTVTTSHGEVLDLTLLHHTEYLLGGQPVTRWSVPFFQGAIRWISNSQGQWMLLMGARDMRMVTLSAFEGSMPADSPRSGPGWRMLIDGSYEVSSQNAGVCHFVNGLLADVNTRAGAQLTFFEQSRRFMVVEKRGAQTVELASLVMDGANIAHLDIGAQRILFHYDNESRLVRLSGACAANFAYRGPLLQTAHWAGISSRYEWSEMPEEFYPQFGNGARPLQLSNDGRYRYRLATLPPRYLRLDRISKTDTEKLLIDKTTGQTKMESEHKL